LERLYIPNWQGGITRKYPNSWRSILVSVFYGERGQFMLATMHAGTMEQPEAVTAHSQVALLSMETEVGLQLDWNPCP
jgi:hypothetical protein